MRVNLVNRLSQLPEKSNRCITCSWMETLEEAEREAIQAAINNPNWTSSALWRVLNSEGLKSGESAFRKHANEH